ncbi:hypothetical protein GEV43_02515 [Actinomadura sp. J1-007]|uniref:caspase family protein n=1 Tax=Actinomadura sp. J1-007 TaxID=2661913 RepID=UPI001321C764|nr:caspase family protein [Actinomadura sp. J1-007]MWK33032.1 hypothetical protein [Actinomadura sp. J1-007]
MSDPRPEPSNSLALLIGASRYQDERIPPVPAALNSLNGIEAMLIDPRLGGWPRDRVIKIADPENPGELLKRMHRLTDALDGVLLLYYAGHGFITSKGELALGVGAVDFDYPGATGVEYPKVRDVLIECGARVKIVILDCCYSGRATHALTADVVSGTETQGVYTLAAADGPARVADLPRQVHTTTAFTGELLSLISEGLPDGEPWLTPEALFGPLKSRLRQKGLPGPRQIARDTAGHFGLARNVAYRPGRRHPQPNQTRPPPPLTTRPPLPGAPRRGPQTAQTNGPYRQHHRKVSAPPLRQALHPRPTTTKEQANRCGLGNHHTTGERRPHQVRGAPISSPAYSSSWCSSPFWPPSQDVPTG